MAYFLLAAKKPQRRHVRGTIRRARGADPDSAGSRFFVTNADATCLGGEYAAFGKAADGIAAIEKAHRRPE